MGFFAGELAAILSAHQSHPQGSPWAILARMGVHPQQIDRLKKANDDIGQIASLQNSFLVQLRQELDLAPMEWARLQASVEADVFFRLLLYHNYPLEEATNWSNAIFASALKDRLAVGSKAESIYVAAENTEEAGPFMRPHRTRGRKLEDVGVTS